MCKKGGRHKGGERLPPANRGLERKNGDGIKHAQILSWGFSFHEAEEPRANLKAEGNAQAGLTPFPSTIDRMARNSSEKEDGRGNERAEWTSIRSTSRLIQKTYQNPRWGHKETELGGGVGAGPSQ